MVKIRLTAFRISSARPVGVPRVATVPAVPPLRRPTAPGSGKRSCGHPASITAAAPGSGKRATNRLTVATPRTGCRPQAPTLARLPLQRPAPSGHTAPCQHRAPAFAAPQGHAGLPMPRRQAPTLARLPLPRATQGSRCRAGIAHAHARLPLQRPTPSAAAGVSWPSAMDPAGAPKVPEPPRTADGSCSPRGP